MKNGIERYYYNNGNIRSETYRLNNKCHRENGPAVIWYYENGNIKKYESYYKDGKWHRENGPAIIQYYDNGKIEIEAYYLNGIEIKDDLEINKMNSLNKKTSIQEDLIQNNIIKTKSRKITILD